VYRDVGYQRRPVRVPPLAIEPQRRRWALTAAPVYTIARNMAAQDVNPVTQPRVVVGTVMSTTLDATNTTLTGIANEIRSNRARTRRA
jgi:hypothetical protein